MNRQLLATTLPVLFIDIDSTSFIVVKMITIIGSLAYMLHNNISVINKKHNGSLKQWVKSFRLKSNIKNKNNGKN